MKKLSILVFQQYSRKISRSIPLVRQEVQREENQRLEEVKSRINHLQNVKDLKEFTKELRLVEHESKLEFVSSIYKRLLKLNQQEILEKEEQVELFKYLREVKQNAKLGNEQVDLIVNMIRLWDQVKQVEELGGSLALMEEYLLGLEGDVKLSFDYLAILLEMITRSHLSQDYVDYWNSLAVRSLVLDEQSLGKNVKYYFVQKVYQCLDAINKKGLVVKNQTEIVRYMEGEIYRFFPSADFSFLLLFLRYRTFSGQYYSEKVMAELIVRAQNVIGSVDELSQFTEQIIKLKYNSHNWITYLCKSLMTTVDSCSQQQQQLDPAKLKILNLSDLLSQFHILSAHQQQVIQTLQKVEMLLLPFFDQMTDEQQLSFLRVHSTLIECLYQEFIENKKQYAASTSKKISKTNNHFYETILPHVKDFSFIQSLQLLEIASVVGISKRSVCRQLFQIGMAGMAKDCHLDPAQKCYALVTYEKLLKLFMTSEGEYVQLEMSIREQGLDPIKLNAEFGHLAVQRQKIEMIK